jgi:hypothetical protein
VARVAESYACFTLLSITNSVHHSDSGRSSGITACRLWPVVVTLRASRKMINLPLKTSLAVLGKLERPRHGEGQDIFSLHDPTTPRASRGDSQDYSQHIYQSHFHPILLKIFLRPRLRDPATVLLRPTWEYNDTRWTLCLGQPTPATSR